MATRVPDVTVVLAVYNTMPYLTECLESVLGQTIGADRLEVIAIDDGSTDDSPAELDAWAARHPGVVTVAHQPNSGSPAAPSNRALDLATGRYVFFLGADDTLGPEALDRLVRAADDLDADIVLGRMVGTGGRVVNQDIYKPGNRDDVTLVNSALPWALSNTKLYRRSMLQEHRIRYPEDLRSGSDQPFTLKALTVARRVAVRADYAFYYAARRTDSSNLTYGTPLVGMLHDATIVMDAAADLVTEPVARHRVHHRHFSWEVGKLVGARFLTGTPEDQRRVVEGVRKLADAYLTEDIRTALTVHRKAAISIAQAGTVDDLLAVLRHHDRHGRSPVVVENGRHYVAYPGFRDPERGFPDEWFDATDELAPAPLQATPAEVGRGRTADGARALTLRWRNALPGLGGPGEPAPRVVIGDLAVPVRVRDDVVSVEVPLDALAGAAKPRRRVRLVGTVAGRTFDRALTATTVAGARRMVQRLDGMPHMLSATLDAAHRVHVAVMPLTPRRLAGKAMGRVRRALRRR